MLNAFNKSQRECRASVASNRKRRPFQASQPLLPLPNRLHLHSPTSLLLFLYCANNLACGNRISAYLRPQMKMPCYWFLLCFFPSSSCILVLFAASWQFNFAGVSTNIELVGKQASSLQSRLTDNLKLETSAQFYINYAIEWEKRRKRILNRYPCVLAQQKRQT